MKYLLTYGNFIFLALLFSFIDNFGMDKKSVENNSNYSFKVLIVGDAGVGKTQIVSRYEKDVFGEGYEPTVSVDYSYKLIKHKTKNIQLQVWDTAGQDSYRSIIKDYYKNSHLIAFVYDITSKDSFTGIPKWVDEVKKQTDKNTKFLLVGNKCDLEEERRAVTEKEAKQYAENNGMKFFEVSAKTGDGINDMFNYIISELLKEKEPGLFDNQYKNDIKINKTSCLNEYCSCCPCLEKTKGNVKK